MKKKIERNEILLILKKYECSFEKETYYESLYTNSVVLEKLEEH